MELLVLTEFKCILCPNVYDNYRSLVAHDNKVHGGYGLKYNKTKWCEGCRAYKDKEDFYEGYSKCKEHSNQAKKDWMNTTTKGFKYKHNRIPSPLARYNALIRKYTKLNVPLNFTKEQYYNKLENGVCDYCKNKFQGIMSISILQPSVGLVLGNSMFSCIICEVKRKYNIN